MSRKTFLDLDSETRGGFRPHHDDGAYVTVPYETGRGTV